MSLLPTDAKARKDVPLYRGLFKYFPDALCAVAELSRVANEQHNPGEPIHWARGKSVDQEDCLLRHMLDLGEKDTDGMLHDVKVAWRALANLQLRLEADAEKEKTEAAKRVVAAEAARRDDGWIPHTNGLRPVQPGTIIDVKFRNQVQRHCRPARSYVWRHDGEEDDIIAWRLAKRDTTAK